MIKRKMRKAGNNILIVCFALVFIGKSISQYDDFGITVFNAGCSGILIIIFIFFLVSTFQMMSSDNKEEDNSNNDKSLTPYAPYYNQDRQVMETIHFDTGDTIITEDGDGQRVGTANRPVKISKIGRR